MNKKLKKNYNKLNSRFKLSDRDKRFLKKIKDQELFPIMMNYYISYTSKSKGLENFRLEPI